MLKKEENVLPSLTKHGLPALEETNKSTMLPFLHFILWTFITHKNRARIEKRKPMLEPGPTGSKLIR